METELLNRDTCIDWLLWIRQILEIRHWSLKGQSTYIIISQFTTGGGSKYDSNNVRMISEFPHPILLCLLSLAGQDK